MHFILSIFYDLPHLISIKAAGSSLLLGLIVSFLIPQKYASIVDQISPWTTRLAFSIALIGCFAYLYFPSYLDHAEPTVTVVGEIWNLGGMVYPGKEIWPFYGSIYGASLFAINSLILTFPGDPIFLSKVPSAIAFIFTCYVLLWKIQSNIAKSYAILVLVFNNFVYWNRPEPFLIAICAICILISQKNNILTAMKLGLLAGFASTFKLHGFLYIFPFMLYTFPKTKYWTEYLLFAVASISILFLPFVSSQVSLENFYQYVLLLSTQKLSETLFGQNIVYLICIWIPIIFVSIVHTYKIKDQLINILIFSVHLLVVFIASKPGAGIHHFLPILIFNSWYLDQLIKTYKSESLYKLLFLKISYCLLGLHTLIEIPNYLSEEVLNLTYIKKLNEAKNEFIKFSNNKEKLLIGVSDGDVKSQDNYILSFYRVLAVSNDFQRQIDPTSYMEYNFSGFKDSTFQDLISNCYYKKIIVPRDGQAFMLHNFYTDKPLFSDQFRTYFRKNYTIDALGKYYISYKCNNN